MKAIKKIIATVILFGGGFWIGSVIISSANSLTTPNQPGGADDPLVTKSYVDQQIQALLDGGYEGNVSGATPPVTEEETTWEIVELRQGQLLLTNIGTELIVRNGKTVIVTSSPNGIADVTAGVDLLNGDAVENNHLLINPGEGRGIKPEESVTGTIFVMVNGDYEIVQEVAEEAS